MSKHNNVNRNKGMPLSPNTYFPTFIVNVYYLINIVYLNVKQAAINQYGWGWDTGHLGYLSPAETGALVKLGNPNSSTSTLIFKKKL